jgi:hypothetical protein
MKKTFTAYAANMKGDNFNFSRKVSVTVKSGKIIEEDESCEIEDQVVDSDCFYFFEGKINDEEKLFFYHSDPAKIVKIAADYDELEDNKSISDIEVQRSSYFLRKWTSVRQREIGAGLSEWIQRKSSSKISYAGDINIHENKIKNILMKMKYDCKDDYRKDMLNLHHFRFNNEFYLSSENSVAFGFLLNLNGELSPVCISNININSDWNYLIYKLNSDGTLDTSYIDKYSEGLIVVIPSYDTPSYDKYVNFIIFNLDNDSIIRRYGDVLGFRNESLA